ncbi:MAG: glutaredoxin [Myxococcota bacterium]|nr:glutaredoxin [Myxococcota bacterium]
MPIRDRLRRLLSLEKPASPPAERAKPAPEPTPTPSTPAARPEHTLVLYKYDACPYCRRVMQVVDRLRLQGTIEYRDTRTEPKWRGDLQERTGRTQVPCLFIDGEAMFESADIGDWLQSNYG